jgi:hypothetical protein
MRVVVCCPAGIVVTHLWPKRWQGHIKTREDVHDLSDGWPLALRGVGAPEPD